jgi:D-alanine transaminase
MIGDSIVPLSEARVSASDRGLFFGDGVYEVLRSCDGRLFAFDQHMDRFAYSLDQIGILDRVDLALTRSRIERGLAASELADALIYVQITRGEGPRSLDPEDILTPAFMMTVRQTPTRKKETVTVISYPDLRWRRCDIKSLNLLPNVLAKQSVRQKGADDAVLVDQPSGLITESSSSSVLLVKRRCLQTAPLTANILASVTRSLLLKWAYEFDLEVREESFTVDQAMSADELVLAGTTTEVTPVVQLDGRTIGSGQIGPVAKLLHTRLLQEMVGKD